MKKPFITAVIAAAGSSVRMGGVDKQLITLGDTPVIVRTVEAFERSDCIGEIIVTARVQALDEITGLLEERHFSKLRAVVPGGFTRQESVFAGIRAASARAEYFAVHDGARPLVSATVIAGAVEGAVCHGAAAPGVSVKETIKEMDDQGFVRRTPNRSSLCIIQTPQVIRRDIYLAGMELAYEKGYDFTDDSQLAEAVGCRVLICPGDERNLKITTPGDIALYELLLKNFV